MPSHGAGSGSSVLEPAAPPTPRRHKADTYLGGKRPGFDRTGCPGPAPHRLRHRLAGRAALEAELRRACLKACRRRRPGPRVPARFARLFAFAGGQAGALTNSGRALVGFICRRLARGAYAFGTPALRAVPKRPDNPHRPRHRRAYPAIRSGDADFLRAYRPVGRPGLHDLLVQRRLLAELRPRLDPHLSAFSFGYRHDARRFNQGAALRRVEALRAEYPFVLKADIHRFFDEIDHGRLRTLFADAMRRGGFADADVADAVALLERFLRCAPRMKGHDRPGHPLRRRGIVQGGPLSTLLANVYLDVLDRALAARGACFVRFADDVLLLFRSRAEAERALDWLRGFLHEALGLALGDKAAVRSFVEGFDFLGFYFQGGTKWVCERTVARFKAKVRALTRVGRCRRDGRPVSVARVVKEINLRFGFVPDHAARARGVRRHRFARRHNWPRYFVRHESGAALRAQFRALDRFVRDRLRHYLLHRRGAATDWSRLEAHDRRECVRRTNNRLRKYGLRSLVEAFDRLAATAPRRPPGPGASPDIHSNRP